MTNYAIGAVNGDFQALTKLLGHIDFDCERDRLWFGGNLVNGGRDSLAVLRFAKQLGSHAVVVLGYQELRLLAIAEGLAQRQTNDTFTDILGAEDRDGLLKWLCQRPLLHHETGFTLVHAGIPAEWSLSQARTFAIEAESSLSVGSRKAFFENIVGATPSRWHAKLRGWKRLRFIVNAFTRLSYCDSDGRFDFTVENATDDPGENHRLWCQEAGRAMSAQKIICANTLGAMIDDVPGIFPLQRGGADNLAICALRLSDDPEIIRVLRN